MEGLINPYLDAEWINALVNESEFIREMKCEWCKDAIKRNMQRGVYGKRPPVAKYNISTIGVR